MCPAKHGAQVWFAYEFAFLLQQQRLGQALVGFLPQTHTPGVARIAKPGPALCSSAALYTACSSLNVLHCRCFAHTRFYLDIEGVLAGFPALPIMLMNEKMLPNIPPASNHRISELEGPFRDHIVQHFSNVYF